VANSNAVQDHFSPPIRSEKMRVIHYGIAVPDAGSNRADLPTLRVLLLGRQTRMKGQEVALAATALLRHEPIDIELRLVGPIAAAYRDDLTRLASKLRIRDRVTITGATTAPQDELAWANVVLMCSTAEAFGRVTVEALKSGRPVIGARSGGTVDLISDGVDGVLVEPQNAEQLASALRRFASESGLLRRMSENARSGMRNRFTIEREVDEFVEVLTAAAAQ
jgi:glycosyltransferase involved in cell wall biosynthesis